MKQPHLHRISKYPIPVVLAAKVLLTCACLMFASGSMAHWCTKATTEEHFKSSDVVFTGKIESIREAPEAYHIKWEESEDEVLTTPTTEVRFTVENVWKGKLDKEALVYTPHLSYSTSSFPFEDAGRYVVFAEFSRTEEHSEEAEVHLRTGFCSGNIGLGDGKSDVDLDELLINTDWRDLGDLGNETTLVERLEELRSKLEDSESTEHAE